MSAFTKKALRTDAQMRGCDRRVTVCCYIGGSEAVYIERFA